DLGANVGQFSWAIAQGLDCLCHAVEPDPELLAQIPAHPRIKTYGYAIAARRAPLVLHRSANRLAASITKNPFSTPDDSGVMVEGVDLKSFLELHVVGPISLIKMDIEGSEVEVLDSLSDEFLVSIPQISVEFHDFCNLTPADVVGRIVKRL